MAMETMMLCSRKAQVFFLMVVSAIIVVAYPIGGWLERAREGDDRFAKISPKKSSSPVNDWAAKIGSMVMMVSPCW